MAEPFALLQGLRASTADLLLELSGLHWSDAEVAAPSLCAAWSRGHILTHIARNADGIADTLSGTLRGQVVPRYAGPGARNAAIEAGAHRAFAALESDVRESAQRLDRVFGAVDDAGAWDRPTAEDQVARHWLLQRWKEVEIHRLDLDAGYSARRWPALFVAEALKEAGDSLDERSSSPLRVRIAAADSLSPGTVDSEWKVNGGGDPVDVVGPDWAVLAWLTGRPTATEGALSATPQLSRYR
jgi:maleylpyruvate isomerase